MPGSRGGNFDVPGLSHYVLTLCKHRAFVTLDVGKGGGRKALQLPWPWLRCGSGPEYRGGDMEIGVLEARAATWAGGTARRGPQGLVDRKLEHRTTGAAQEQMPAVVVDAYQS